MTIPALSTRVDKTRLGRDGPSLPSIDRVTAAARDGLAAAIRESIETGESGELRRNRGRRIAQDRRRGPLEGYGDRRIRALLVPTLSQHLRRAAQWLLLRAHLHVGRRSQRAGPSFDPPMARPLTYPVEKAVA